MAVSTNYSYVPFLGDSSSSTAAASSTSSLGKDDFLQLLVTQLRYQDPLEPVADTEFIAQMASFSTLEQMTNLNTSFEGMASVIYDYLIPQMQWQQAGQMIGKEVTYQNPSAEEGVEELLTGVVTSTLISDGQIVFMINGTEVPIGNICQISEAGSSSQDILEDILDQLEELVGNTDSTGDDTNG